MTERPTLLSADEVRGILAGRQTQLRRVVKPQPECEGTNEKGESVWRRRGSGPTVLRTSGLSRVPLICGSGPFGQPGDKLWGRETWWSGDHPDSPLYRADGDMFLPSNGKWRPSVHMPRWASRITLEVTAVGVERLQDLCIEDADASGFEDESDPYMAAYNAWSARNPKHPWESDPWTWVVKFEVVK